ncbi:bone morphogenetic protein 15 [Xyrichtys novacula]|uniref:Bone morphogenetic protein 15 n=1 Tax=Xyrichtys novacula TaxID=13765 RepID=A0AAV1HJ57_XYRNO|nr:bone morphogenetic protein 15 [Xyrichtys novacula]
MTSTRRKHDLPRVCVLTSLIYLLCSTCTGHGLVPGNKTASYHPTLRRSHPSARQKGAQHHRPLTDEQKADQNLQFMLSLYRSAAEPDGRPKQHRKFGSNTVRLLRPTASTVNYLPASRDHHYSFTVQYNLDTLPSEQLVKASFIHLRSSSSTSSTASNPSDSTQVLPPPRCRAQITALGRESLVTLEPHEQWTETDITRHVQQGNYRDTGGHLTLTAQYWCTDPGYADEDDGLSGRWTQGKKRWTGEPHVEVPSLLLYLEEEREVGDWMGELLGAEGENIMRRLRPWHPPFRSRRHSKDPQLSEPKDPSLDALKNAPPSSSMSFSTSPSSTSILSEIPSYKHKTGTPKNRCKLHSFRLSFDELGWGHYFIAPPVYNPRFCKGNCPRVLHYGYHSPHHAIIQTVINDLGVGDVPPPSCVPYKYMPMSVLVMDKKKVEYKELEDMVAESCTCR